MNDDMPPLLEKLVATVDNPAVFPVDGVPDSETFKAELRLIWGHLYDNARNLCLMMLDEGYEGDEMEFTAASLTKKYMPLHSDWRDSFTRAARETAKTATEGDQRFIYFMLGYMEAGWEEYLRQKHGV